MTRLRRSRQHGRDQNRKCHGAEKSQRNRPGHGSEQAALHALQREDRQVGGDNDGDGVENRPLHFMAGFADDFGGCPRDSAVAIAMGQVTDDVLHHDHGAIHDHAKIQRAER